MTDNILIIGANGQLGNEMKDLIGMVPQCNFLFTDREQLDLTQPQQLTALFEKHHFSFCINVAAYTAVDKAETDSATAEAVNATAVHLLAQTCHQHHTILIHISTDFVFDGLKNSWYNEKDTPNPISIYGKTKWQGEEAVRAECPHHIILRTAWLYSKYGNNFVKTMLKLGKEKPMLSVIADQTGTPTYARDLAKVIMNITEKLYQEHHAKNNLNPYFGTYHYSNEGTASWYDFANAIFELVHLQVNLKAIATTEYPTPALRPKFSVLDKTKIKATFGVNIPHWRESLKKCLLELQKVDE
jgi:dTDP-4-dehydrorhamnose reductase